MNKRNLPSTRHMVLLIPLMPPDVTSDEVGSEHSIALLPVYCECRRVSVAAFQHEQS